MPFGNFGGLGVQLLSGAYSKAAIGNEQIFVFSSPAVDPILTSATNI
jgi:hypothetical protein